MKSIPKPAEGTVSEWKEGSTFYYQTTEQIICNLCKGEGSFEKTEELPAPSIMGEEAVQLRRYRVECKQCRGQGVLRRITLTQVFPYYKPNLE